MSTCVLVRSFALTMAFASVLVLGLPGDSSAQPVLPPPAPPLPPPSGAVINVATVQQLQAAFASLTSGSTIVIQPGVYRLTSELRIRNNVTNVGIRGATNNRDDVVLLGSGMSTPGVNIVISVENAQDVLIANLSIGEAFYHPIQLHGEFHADRVHVYNVRLFDAGQQFLKSTVDFQNPDGTDDVRVEYSLIEYTSIGTSHGYTEGIDVHHGANWVIQHNLFRNIHVPPTAQDFYRPAILMWSGSRNTLVYRNTFIDCERAIIFGLGPQTGFAHSHSGGAIVNNFIYRTEPVHADAGISVWDSPNTRVLNNTVLLNGTYPNAIEYRFPGTTGVEIANNLTDAAIAMRDGAQGAVFSNYTQATPALFNDVSQLDLHLRSSALVAIDTGTTLNDVTIDWDGDTRPAGIASDIGADEYRSTPANRPPAAVIAASPTSGMAPLTISVDGRGSSDPDGDTLSHGWSFGDGSSGTGSTSTHTYTTAGTFIVTLTVTDPAGATNSASVAIVVSGSNSLAAPTDLRATVFGATVRLQWADNAAGETKYVVERALRKGPFAAIGSLGANARSFDDVNVPRGVYRYRVQAVDEAAGASSGWSNAAQVHVR
jgi:PKD repeat protein